MERRGSVRARGLTAACVVVAMCVPFLGSGCSSLPTEAEETVVAVTLLPQAGFVEAVGGERVEVMVMVPPGASPHTYEVTPYQMVQLSQAKMYARVGSPVEFELAWMDRLISVNDEMLVVDCSKGVQFIDAEEGVPHEGEDDVHSGVDPHIWLSVRNAKIMVENICEGLVQVDPANAEYYTANCLSYVRALTQLDDDLTESMKVLENRTFVVFHPSFGYFARDYNLIQLAVEQGGSEPDAQYIVRLIAEARARDIRIVFVAPQISSRSAEVIAREIGGEVVIIDPLARNYVPNMRAVADAIQQMG